MVDALVAKAEEGRGRLRKVLGSRQQIMIQQYPNGETPLIEISEIPIARSRMVSRGTETSKYPEQKKSYEIPLVAVSENG
jgi:hypothetical protein